VTGRRAALMALERFRRSGSWSDAVLDGIVQKCGMDRREAALASRLCYGVLQNMALCDFYIGSYSSVPPKKMEPKVLDILRISAYQILFLDKIPSRAAVNEGVKLCKSLGFGRASGLVNAVLRRLSENRDNLPEIPNNDPADYLSLRYSHPKWLTEELLREHGPEFTENFFRANNDEAPMTAQANTLKIDTPSLIKNLEAEGVAVSAHPWLENCVLLSGTGDLTELSSFKRGEFYIQDAAARLAVVAADPKPGQRVLDACAAPGGKSFAAAILMENSGEIIACDIHKSKLSRIENAARRLEIDIIYTRACDARRPDEDLHGSADIVIADVPCSGLGVIRKKPDIRYKNPRELAGLPDIQLDILKGLTPCVKPGGTLIYSTCTVRRQENEGVIEQFLNINTEFKPEAFKLPGPAGLAESGHITLWPHIHETDGFFICKLRKKP